MQNFIIRSKTFRFTPKELFMRNSKKLYAIILSAIMLATGCADNTAPGESTGIKENSSVTTENSGNSEPDTKSVVNAVKDISVDTKVKILSWYSLNDNGIAKIYKELFGVPENIPQGYEESNSWDSGNDTESSPDEQPFAEIRVTSYADRYSNLAKLIQADDSPDAFPAQLYAMMYFNSNDKSDKYFDAVDGVIDFGLSELAPYSKIQNDIRMFDKNYCPIYNVSPSSVLWYRSSVIKNAGLEDPWELYEKDEWTWNKFLEMCEKFSDGKQSTENIVKYDGNIKFGIDGDNVPTNLLATTGIHLFGNDNGLYIDNSGTDKMKAAMEFLRQFDTTQKSLRYPRDLLNNWAPNYREWAKGNTLFFEDGIWRYEEKWIEYKEKEKWSEDEINFVPFPRYDAEKTYSQNMNTTSFLLPKGSKNKVGYQSLIYTDIYARNNTEMQKASRQYDKAECGWNDRLLDKAEKISQPDAFNWVCDYSSIALFIIGSGCGEDVPGALLNNTFLTGVKYDEVLEEYGSVNSREAEMLNTPPEKSTN